MKACKECGFYPVSYQVVDLAGGSEDLYYYKCPKCGRKTDYYETEQEAADEWELMNGHAKEEAEYFTGFCMKI